MLKSNPPLGKRKRTLTLHTALPTHGVDIVRVKPGFLPAPIPVRFLGNREQLFSQLSGQVV